MEIDFNKNKDGLVPVIIQNYLTEQVLMLGYMNPEAYNKTKKKEKSPSFPAQKTGYGQKEKLPGIFWK
jgi:phosphoribosyl-ATP pyrophosphohydrolase/phosphoribosyl-AMP cyclohydrolase